VFAGDIAGEGKNLDAPLGLIGFQLLATAYAVGCILTPLRGCRLTVLFHRVVEIPVLTH